MLNSPRHKYITIISTNYRENCSYMDEWNRRSIGHTHSQLTRNNNKVQ